MDEDDKKIMEDHATMKAEHEQMLTDLSQIEAAHSGTAEPEVKDSAEVKP